MGKNYVQPASSEQMGCSGGTQTMPNLRGLRQLLITRKKQYFYGLGNFIVVIKNTLYNSYRDKDKSFISSSRMEWFN
jgi:hypothetical protein